MPPKTRHNRKATHQAGAGSFKKRRIAGPERPNKRPRGDNNHSNATTSAHKRQRTTYTPTPNDTPGKGPIRWLAGVQGSPAECPRRGWLDGRSVMLVSAPQGRQLRSGRIITTQEMAITVPNSRHRREPDQRQTPPQAQSPSQPGPTSADPSRPSSLPQEHNSLQPSNTPKPSGSPPNNPPENPLEPSSVTGAATNETTSNSVEPLNAPEAVNTPQPADTENSTNTDRPSASLHSPSSPFNMRTSHSPGSIVSEVGPPDNTGDPNNASSTDLQSEVTREQEASQSPKGLREDLRISESLGLETPTPACDSQGSVVAGLSNTELELLTKIGDTQPRSKTPETTESLGSTGTTRDPTTKTPSPTMVPNAPGTSFGPTPVSTAPTPGVPPTPSSSSLAIGSSGNPPSPPSDSSGSEGGSDNDDSNDDHNDDRNEKVRWKEQDDGMNDHCSSPNSLFDNPTNLESRQEDNSDLTEEDGTKIMDDNPPGQEASSSNNIRSSEQYPEIETSQAESSEPQQMQNQSAHESKSQSFLDEETQLLAAIAATLETDDPVRILEYQSGVAQWDQSQQQQEKGGDSIEQEAKSGHSEDLANNDNGQNKSNAPRSRWSTPEAIRSTTNAMRTISRLIDSAPDQDHLFTHHCHELGQALRQTPPILKVPNPGQGRDGQAQQAMAECIESEMGGLGFEERCLCPMDLANISRVTLFQAAASAIPTQHKDDKGNVFFEV